MPTMINAGKTLGCLACGLVLCAAAIGNATDSSDNPYQGIVDRNVFGLRPPPPPPSTDPVKPPLPPISLTGITTILGKKLAFMSVQVPPKPGEQGKGGPQSYMLGIGEREGDIEVIDIDEKGGTVKMSYTGVITNVPFAKLPNTPSAPVNTAAIPSPHQNPIGTPGLPPQRSIPGLPSRTMRMSNSGSPGTPGADATGAAVQPGIGQPSAAAPQQPPMTAEEDAILTEAHRELYRGDSRYPPLPPTQITSPDDLKQIMQPGSRLPKGWQQMPQAPQ
jgi:hypothetical protein